MTGWMRSSRCAAGDCIEIMAVGEAVVLKRIVKRERFGDGVRWSHSVPRAEWDAFVAGIKAGDFDQLGDTSA